MRQSAASICELTYRASRRPLVIAGAQGTAAPPKYGREIADRIPRARLEVLEHAAHLASVERGEEVSDLIAAHVAQ